MSTTTESGTAALIALDGIGASLGSRRVLQQVNCSIRPGEMIGIIGPNGAGKSSLVRVMAGLLSPDSGSVQLEGRELREWTPTERARRIAYLPQGAPVHWPLAVRAVVELGRLPYRSGWGGSDPGARAAVDAALAAAEVEALQDRLVTELSGGERMRVMIARLLAAEPRVILADEPVAGLDAFHQLQAMEVLGERAKAGIAVLIVLHDLCLAARFCDRLLLLDQGELVAEGTPAEVLVSHRLETVYGVKMRNVDGDGIRLLIPWERATAAKEASPELAPRSVGT